MSSPDDTVDIPMGQPPGSTGAAGPRSMQVNVDLGAATHQGLVRTNNEDSYLVTRAERSLETLLTNLPPGDIPDWAAERSYGFIIADGMGGEVAGEVASRLALRTVIEHVLATADWVMRDAAVHSGQIEERIAERFAAADEAVLAQANSNPYWAGMGTTMTLAVTSGADLFLGHVGDSRAYILRGGQLQLLTHDHSFGQALADMGVIGPQDVAAHRMRHLLLRSLGGRAGQADLRHLPLENGDQLLLCTDGLTDMVDGAGISAILHAAASSQMACDQLIAAALSKGGKDNVTVLVARYTWLQP